VAIDAVTNYSSFIQSGRRVYLYQITTIMKNI